MSSTPVFGPPTSLRRMPPQSAAFSPDDDLVGVTNSALRRRIQNRLNQRAYRARHEARARSGKGTNEAQKPGYASTLPVVRSGANSLPNPILCTLCEAQHSQCTFAPAKLHTLMDEFEKRALNSYFSASPKTDLLISLSRLNVLRAAYDNVMALGMTAEWLCQDNSISIFSTHGPQLSEDKIPSSLRPTDLQRSTPHHPWLDIFPFPEFRNNLIRAGDNLDDDELCHDLTAFWDTRTSNARLLVWALPSCPENWEVTEDFARKWGFFLRGCPSILNSTNKWRKQRGEKPLVWKRIFGIY